MLIGPVEDDRYSIRSLQVLPQELLEANEPVEIGTTVR